MGSYFGLGVRTLTLYGTRSGLKVACFCFLSGCLDFDLDVDRAIVHVMSECRRSSSLVAGLMFEFDS